VRVFCVPFLTLSVDAFLPQVCQEAALGPIRELDAAALRSVRAEDVRPLSEQVSTTVDVTLLVFQLSR
jgi:hypothetical protein